MTLDEMRAAMLDRYVVLRVEVGSTAHGVTHSSNDMDEIAVYVPPPIEVLGLDTPEHFVYRPGRGPHDPSEPGDLDRVYYSLQKYMGLLTRKGNPTVLYTLHGPTIAIPDQLGYVLRELAPHFRNEQVKRAYLGYARAQRERIQGDRGAAGRMRRSPEGGGEIDWKYAMHMLRLGIQGVEYLSTGKISSPSLELDYLKAVRAGIVSLDDVVDKALDNEAKIAAFRFPVRRKQDWNEWTSTMTLDYWRRNGDMPWP